MLPGPGCLSTKCRADRHRGLSLLPDILQESNILKMQQPDPVEPKRSPELWLECHEKNPSQWGEGDALRE